MRWWEGSGQGNNGGVRVEKASVDNALEEGWPGRKTRVREGAEGGHRVDRIQGQSGCCRKDWVCLHEDWNKAAG